MAEVGYEPIDVGDERRLERFGPVLVDRPAPGAIGPRRAPAAWAKAGARFEREGRDGRWTLLAPLPDPWRLAVGDLGFELDLRPAAAGQVGAFPEQAVVWRSLVASVRSWRDDPIRPSPDPPAVLSLFAYTGAATLACAAAGASVVHVDASRTAVAWARRNAGISDLAAAPVRWIAEDARSFVAREARRGRRYDGIVLDPPSYGHGPEGHAWRLEEDLEPLLDALAGLVSATPAFVALTAHTRDFGPDRLTDLLGVFDGGSASGGSLELVAASGARLALGAYALWTPA